MAITVHHGTEPPAAFVTTSGSEKHTPGRTQLHNDEGVLARPLLRQEAGEGSGRPPRKSLRCCPQLQAKHLGFRTHPRSQIESPGETGLTLSPPVASSPALNPFLVHPCWSPSGTRTHPCLLHGQSPGFEFIWMSPKCLFLFLPQDHPGPQRPCTHPCGYQCAHPRSIPPLCQFQGAHTVLWEDRPGEEISQALEASWRHLGTELQGPRC